MNPTVKFFADLLQKEIETTPGLISEENLITGIAAHHDVIAGVGEMNARFARHEKRATLDSQKSSHALKGLFRDSPFRRRRVPAVVLLIGKPRRMWCPAGTDSKKESMMNLYAYASLDIETSGITFYRQIFTLLADDENPSAEIATDQQAFPRVCRARLFRSRSARHARS